MINFLIKIKLDDMIESQFQKYNDIFNKKISKNELDDDYCLIDNESIISRVHKKIDGQIDDKLLSIILIFNISIKDENYVDAQYWKNYILNNF